MTACRPTNFCDPPFYITGTVPVPDAYFGISKPVPHRKFIYLKGSLVLLHYIGTRQTSTSRSASHLMSLENDETKLLLHEVID